MNIDQDTKVMLRLHRKANTRGLQIYNPYFQQSRANALYLLVYNEDPKPLIEGILNLNFAGGIAAGFEKSPELILLMDELTEESQRLQRVGIVVNNNGKLRGHYQGGQGLYQSVTTKYGKFSGKRLCILGAGTVAKALLIELEKQKDIPEVTIVNRTLENAEKLANEFTFIKQVKPFEELTAQEGDIFLNTTYIGSPWNQGEDYKFTENFVKNFNFVADVTFVPIKPQLIELAEKCGIEYAAGHRMFMYQAKVCLENIMGITPDLDLFEKLMLKDFEVNWS